MVPATGSHDVRKRGNRGTDDHQGMKSSWEADAQPQWDSVSILASEPAGESAIASQDLAVRTHRSSELEALIGLYMAYRLF